MAKLLCTCPHGSKLVQLEDGRKVWRTQQTMERVTEKKKKEKKAKRSDEDQGEGSNPGEDLW